jgi:hypothetical protein
MVWLSFNPNITYAIHIALERCSIPFSDLYGNTLLLIRYVLSDDSFSNMRWRVLLPGLNVWDDRNITAAVSYTS